MTEWLGNAVGWLWELLYLGFRIFVILMIITIVGGAIKAWWEWFNDPDRRHDWRDDFR